jgi:squalene-hopene/tetraprenyl-beta-curcumene cyclase
MWPGNYSTEMLGTPNNCRSLNGLRLLGVPTTDPPLIRAKTLILEKGGISKTRIFTKLHLALIGCYHWRGLPSLPP